MGKRKNRFCKIWYQECRECGALFVAPSPLKSFCSAWCIAKFKKKKEIQRKVWNLPNIRSPKYKNFSPRYHLEQDCLIVEMHKSRCDEYLRGECDKCFDYCVKYNWVGWKKLRKITESEKRKFFVTYNEEMRRFSKKKKRRVGANPV